MQLRHVVLLALQGFAATALAQESRAWSIRWLYEEDASQSLLGQDYRPTKQQFTVRREFDATTSALGQHQYRILDLPTVNGQEPDTNGHVHRLTFEWLHQAAPWRVQIGAVLSVSSNALKHLDDLSFSDLQPDVIVEREVADALWLGLRADDRLGRTLVYPSVLWQIQPAPAHEIRLGFPEASWRWRWTKQLESVLGVAPDGSVWRVRNKELTRHSDVQIRSWLAGFSVRWLPFDGVWIEGRAGRRFAAELRYLLRDGSEARVDVTDGNVFGVALGARF
jgi:hypothetical protein